MMRWLCAAIVLLTAAAHLPPPAEAADYSLRRDRAVSQQSWIRAARPLPFPRSARAQAVWAEGGCWKICQIDCTDMLDRGVEADGDQVAALAATNRCDRSCQQACRIAGGPLVPPLPQ